MTTLAREPLRRVLLPLRILLGVAAVLVVIAGFQLFVLSADTATYFAWTLAPPSAAVLGANYWGSIPLVAAAMLAPDWRTARVGLWSVLTFTTLTLVATLLHLDKFHFAADSAISVTAAWAWLIVYVVVPPVLAILLLVQMRMPGPDAFPRAPLPRPLAVLIGLIGVVLFAAGLALFFVPAWASAWWPWPLTPLAGQAIGAWPLAFAVAAASILVENDLDGSFWPVVSFGLLGALQLVVVARFADALDWSQPAALVYIAFWAGVVLIGVVTAAAARPRRM